jgi:peptide-methionine (S)-S-oxide reductase
MCKSIATIFAISLGILLVNGCDTEGEANNMSGSDTESETSAPAERAEDSSGYEKATFAAGCFWGVEAAFAKVPGIVSTQVGYTGGHTENPTYKQVCTDKTGHAEALEVTYDPAKISYEQLLAIFWSIHDPTTLNRQGPDVGTQYRSAIFYHNKEQQAAAEASKRKLEQSGRFDRPIVTEITPASKFYRAEEYHQRYFQKHGLPSCHLPNP